MNGLLDGVRVGPAVPPLADTRTTARIELSIELPYQVGQPGGDFIFSLLAARTDQQGVLSEEVDLGGRTATVFTDPATGNRLMPLHVEPGDFTLRYHATVELRHRWSAPQTIGEVPVGRMPPAVLPFLFPSRYCPSDRLQQLAATEFGTLAPGYGKVLAIRDWVRQRVTFTMNTSNGLTGAIETLEAGVGVCRDFAHLMIAMCRAASIPARFTTGIDYGADPALGPTDFHAYVEVFLADRWFIIDPSGTAIPMGFVRLASGRDAADVAFATIFGPVLSGRPVLTVAAIAGSDGVIVRPEHRDEALSMADAPQAWAGVSELVGAGSRRG